MRIFNLIAVLTAFLCLSSAYAQDNVKVPTNDQCGYFYSNGNGESSNPMFTTTQPAPQQFSQQKTDLLNQIKTAKSNGNVALSTELQNRLNEMDGGFNAELVNDERVGVRSDYNRAPFVSTEGDYNVSTINTAGLWAIATSTSSKSTAIFAAVTEFVNGAGDMLKVYASYNGGQTWVLKYTFNGFVAEVDMRAGELDIEATVNAADTIVWCTFGYTFNGHAFSRMERVNIGAGTGTGGAYAFGGYLGTTFQTYNPRVTSDNTNYGAATYVYWTVSIDSVTSGGNKKITQRYAVYLTPFTNNTVTYRVANAAGGGFWWHGPSVPTSVYLWQDICYYNSSGGDRVYTVFDQTNLNTLYLAWSNDYGVTNAGSLSIAETITIDRAIIAANGGPTQQTLVVGYRRLFAAAGNDWDFRGQFATTGGIVIGDFTANYPDFTTNEAKHVDVQAIDLANGRYVFGTSMTNNNNGYWRQTNSPTGATFGTIYQINSSQVDTSFGGVVAGYRKTGASDSSIAIWSQVQGAGAYCSYNISSTVGVNNNGSEVPNVYSLSQNYPNPFNPVTNIKFSIPNTGVVKLVIYDIMGREVLSLINQNLQSGSYTVDVDASNLSSGVYFYSLTAGDFKDTKKMMLVK